LITPMKRTSRGKALMAIVFAGGMLNSQLPSLAESNSATTDSVMQQIATSTQMQPETRAFFLLKLASRYITSGDKSVVDAEFKQIADKPNIPWPYGKHSREDIRTSWITGMSLESYLRLDEIRAKPEARHGAQSTPDENLAAADAAIRKALAQLDQSTDAFAKTTMYFIASRLFQRLGNSDGEQECNRDLEKAFKSCEGIYACDEEQIKAAVLILNFMADTITPVQLPTSDLNGRPILSSTVKSFPESDLKTSEKLKLRAVAMADRLGSTNHVRRLAHRNLALWYMALGRIDMAEKEKQILFELVGCKDDTILFPIQAACGHEVWWEKHTGMGGFCGMG
jgi:hypothetical protein